MKKIKHLSIFLLALAMLNLQTACIQYKRSAIPNPTLTRGEQVLDYYLHYRGKVYRFTDPTISSQSLRGTIDKRVEAGKGEPCASCTEMHFFVDGATELGVDSDAGLRPGKVFEVDESLISKTLVKTMSEYEPEINKYKGLFTATSKLYLHDGQRTFLITNPRITNKKLIGKLYAVQRERESRNESSRETIDFYYNAGTITDNYLGKDISVDFTKIGRIERYAIDTQRSYFSSLYLGMGIAGTVIVAAVAVGFISYLLILASGQAANESSGGSGSNSGSDSGNSGSDSGDSGSGDSGSSGGGGTGGGGGGGGGTGGGGGSGSGGSDSGSGSREGNSSGITINPR